MLQMLKRALGAVGVAKQGKARLYPVDLGSGAIGWYYRGETGAEAPIAAVASFAGRTGAVTPQQADYDGFFLTPAEGNAMYDALGLAAAAQAAAASDATTKANAAQSAAASDATTKANNAQAYAVQRANHTGTQTSATISDFATAAAAAAPVQSVNGKTGAVVTGFSSTSSGALPAAQANSTADVDYVTLSLTAAQAASLLAGATFAAEIYGVQSNAVTANPSLAAKLKVNGAAIGSVSLAMGTTAQTNRPFVARLEISFRAVGSSGAVIGGGELTVNGVAPAVAIGTATTAVNTTAALTISLALAWSAAATGNTLNVYQAAIDQIA